MKWIIALFAMGLVLGCASKKENSVEAQGKLDEKWTPKVGTALKSEFVETYGTADWCRPKESSGETCRFYLKTGTKWTGEKRDKKAHLQYEEVLAEFDDNGVLTKYKGTAQK